MTFWKDSVSYTLLMWFCSYKRKHENDRIDDVAYLMDPGANPGRSTLAC